jgi:UDP-glucose 4-epimerase
MSVLVTGGAGYIGSVAVEQLVAAGEPVVVLDNLSTGHRAAVAPEARFIEGDIRDKALVRRVLGWKPSRGDIDVIVRDAWDWYQAHPRGYSNG